MNANQITFGVEIEATIPEGSIRVGGHGYGLSIPQLPGWKADGDPSIRAGHGRQACEFVSPIYTGIEGLQQFVRDVATIKSLGAQVNASCGLHIHVGFDKADADALARVTSLVSNYERAIYATTGTKNRERGQWCRGLSQYGNVATAHARARYQRYHVLNLATDKPTVEFRAFSGSLNPAKLIAYVRLCVGMVEQAIEVKRSAKWSVKPVTKVSPIKARGDGQYTLTRLYYQLGWIKGRTAYVFGDLIGDGLPTIKATKRELMKLARKYDAQL